ncbi:MAG: hypothetical protein WD063_04600 [Pirellulales bacterium]
MRTERDLLVDCLARLNRLGVPYMLAGSMASNYWGIPRTTHDLDFVVRLQPGSVEGLVAAFKDGFFIQGESVEKALRPPYQFNALDEQSALKVDFWTLRDDAFERAAFERRVQFTLFEMPAVITTAEDVILHKLYRHKLTLSDRQLDDAAGVYCVQRDTLDTAYLDHWASILGVQPELHDLTTGKIKPKST